MKIDRPIQIEPEPPVKLMRIATGVGKSHEARVQARHIVATLPPGTCLVITTSTHALNNEYLSEMLKEKGLSVAVFRGRNAHDPDRPGKFMCDLADEAAQLSSAGGEPLHLCSRKKKDGEAVLCPYFNECGYLKQYEQSPQVWITAHALMPRKPPVCIPEIGAVINDEDPLQKFLKGFDRKRPVRVSMDELGHVRAVPTRWGGNSIDADATSDLEVASAALHRALAQ
jgi:putative DNA primase/helicase